MLPESLVLFMSERAQADQGSLDAGFSSQKRHILLTLKRQGETSLGDLSTELGISKMATLKHLTALEGKGLVERSFRSAGRGRPRAYFRLSRNATSLFPKAYTQMTLSALRFIEEKLGRDAVEGLLRQRAQEVLESNRNRFRAATLRERVDALVTVRDEGGYMAERGRTGPTTIEMLEHNCPIMAVAESYPEACSVERELFQKLLRADVETSHRVVSGDPVCRFLIRKRKESA